MSNTYEQFKERRKEFQTRDEAQRAVLLGVAYLNYRKAMIAAADALDELYVMGLPKAPWVDNLDEKNMWSNHHSVGGRIRLADN